LCPKIEDEFTFISELSEYLSIRYNRPASCIVTTLQHGICIQFGGSCDPSYTIKTEALTRDMQPAANKRNVALLQRHMEQHWEFQHREVISDLYLLPRTALDGRAPLLLER